jgi:ATP-dependent RNA helicase DeaD
MTPMSRPAFESAHVAAAAMKLVHEESGGAAAADEEEIEIYPQRNERSGGFDRGQRSHGGDRGGFGPRGHGAPRGPGDFAPRHARGRQAGLEDGVRLFIGAGHQANVRAGDLVGAITHEAGIRGEDIGPIRITERFSLVEVRAEHAERVIEALRGTTLRGRKVMVRRDRNS